MYIYEYLYLLVFFLNMFFFSEDGHIFRVWGQGCHLSPIIPIQLLKTGLYRVYSNFASTYLVLIPIRLSPSTKTPTNDERAVQKCCLRLSVSIFAKLKNYGRSGDYEYIL